MPRILKEKGYSEKLLIPASEFRLCRELDSHALDGEKLKEIIKKAEQYLDTPVYILSVCHYKLFETKGDREEYQKGYFERRNMALTLAFAEAHERQGRFTEKLIDVVWAIMEESTWVIPAHLKDNTMMDNDRYLPPVYGNGQLQGICLFAASTAACLALVYHLCRDILDEFSPIICEKIKHLIRERIVMPYTQCKFWWDGTNGGRVINWCPWVTSNILLAVGICEDDGYLRERVVQKAIYSLDCYSDNGVMSDGGCDEGPSYWGAAGACYFDALELLYDLTGGKIDIFGEKTIRDMLEYIVKVNVNGRRFLNFSDCPPESNHDGAMLRRMGEKCGSEVLCSFGDVMAQYNDVSVSQGHPYRNYRNMITAKAQPKKSVGMTRVWLPAMKIMLARESEDTSKGMLVAITGGNNGTAHSHNDIGNVTLYYDGEPVLIDTGSGVYTKKTFSKDRYTIWYMQSCYHNVADINGMGQKNGGNFRSSDETYDEGTGRVTMQLATAYEEAAGVKSYIRSCQLDGGTVTVKDSFLLAREGEIDIHFLTHQKPELLEDGRIALAKGRVMSFSEGLRASVEEFEVDDKNIRTYWRRDTLFRIHLKATVTEAEFTITVE